MLLLPPTNEAVDVCAQIPFALPGTCKLIGRGVYDNEFKCQCINAAYRWRSEPGAMAIGKFPRCELVAEFDNLEVGETIRVSCNTPERLHFCDPIGSQSCYYEASRETIGANLVKVSLWPVCECRSGYSGVTCERRRDVCEDTLVLTSSDASALHGLLGLPEQLTANWLCDANLGGSKCVPDVPSRSNYGYRCECQPGAGRDPRFQGLDNCKTRVQQEFSKFGPPSRCEPGYAGDDCDMTINPWSDWSSWSECFPACGNHRRRLRHRICLGDFGCIGSTQMTKRCSAVECAEFDDSDAEIQVHNLSEFKDNGGFFIPTNSGIFFTTFLLVIPSQIALIALVTWLVIKKDRKRFGL
uniref:EGF-like domain-containing protein n=1 Tax=Mesocestoides corti TaxID=53468 RepID=A0A5K3FZQ9_MESCO